MRSRYIRGPEARWKQGRMAISKKLCWRWRSRLPTRIQTFQSSPSLYPLAQPSKDLLAIDALPALQRLDAPEQLRFEFLGRSRHSGQALLLILSEPPQPGANN